jgi:hypothetical protein
VIALEAIEAAITPRTRAVVSSSVMYATGFRQDLTALGALCRRRGVRLLVDATQSAGIMPIDVRRDAVDALVFSGYKWTTSGYGIAAMYVSRELLRQGRTPLAGWWSARDPEAVINDRLDLKDTAAVFEVGCPHFAGIFALGGSLELFEEIGAGITIVRVDNAPAIVEALARAGIVVSPRGAGVRAAVHVFNTEDDIDRFVAAVAALTRGETLPAPSPSPPPRVVCVDLNGVLDRYAGWQGPDHWDSPAPGAREFLRTLHEHGCRIVVFTTRHYAGVHRWLAEHGMLEYISDVTDIKPAADVFVDDRAICHRGDFRDTLQQVLGFTVHWQQDAERTRA